MRKFLCLENNQYWYRDFKIGKIYTGDEGVIEDDHRCDWGTEELLEDGVIQPIETFERDGVEWIKHDGGDCPVPGDWRVEFSHESGGHVFGRGGLRASLFCWGPIVAYRIISTCEPEESGAGGGIELGDKDQSEINDTKENLSLMDTLTQNQRDYITRKELEQVEKQKAHEQAKSDEIEHKQQQSNDLDRANGVMK